MAEILEALRFMAQMQERRFALFQIRRGLAEFLDERRLQRLGLFQPFHGGTLDPGVQKSGQGRVVAGDAEPFEIVQAERTFSGSAPIAHQFVGGDALGRYRRS